VLVVAMLLVPAVAIVVVRQLTPGSGGLPSSSSAPEAVSVPVEASGPEDRTPEVRGRILDADGNAAGAASVRLVSPSPPFDVFAEVTADAEGAFSFPRVTAARVRVVAQRDPGGVVTSAELLPSPGRSLDVVLVLSAAGAVRGTVVDTEDHPVGGAVITVEGAPWIARRQTSDEAGAFRLTAVPEEATSLVVVARGYRSVRVSLPRSDGAEELVVRVRLEAASAVTGIVVDDQGNPVAARVVACNGQPAEARVESDDQGAFELPASAIGCDAFAERDDAAPSDPASVVEGRNLRLRLRSGGAVEGFVVDGRGAGVPSFRVGIESFAGRDRRAAGASGGRDFDDPRGAFRWDKLPPGTYTLTASAPGLPPARSDAIDVASGSVTRNVRIVLAPGGTVVGHVTDDRHAPLAGVELRFDLVSSVLESRASARTDDSGAYRLEGAPAGPLTLRAQKDGFRLRMVSALRVGPGQTITQDLVLTPSDGHGNVELGGIGAGISQGRDGLTFGAVFPGDPAERAGLAAGDRILRIDGESTDGMSVADAIQRLRGEVGTSVGISVQKAGSGQTVDVVVVRGTIVR
jgi:hypothetical protein